ncbi:MAG: hypothetical protein Q7I93_01965 [Syntrophales bacterium]|nr:hypothetical protein [Syntrophales bacterium]
MVMVHRRIFRVIDLLDFYLQRKIFRQKIHASCQLGNKMFIEALEGKLGKILAPQKGGRPKKQKN